MAVFGGGMRMNERDGRKEGIGRDRETRGQGDKEMGGWGDGEMGDGEMGRRRDKAKGRIGEGEE